MNTQTFCNGLFDIFRTVHPEGRNWLQGIRMKAVQCLWRSFACNATIHSGTQCIYVGPWSLIAMLFVLFFWCISMFDDYGHAVFIQSNKIFCPAKIQDFDASISHDHDIIRADISVDQILAVQFSKRSDQRLHHFDKFACRDFSSPHFKILLQCSSV